MTRWLKNTEVYPSKLWVKDTEELLLQRENRSQPLIILVPEDGPMDTYEELLFRILGQELFSRCDVFTPEDVDARMLRMDSRRILITRGVWKTLRYDQELSRMIERLNRHRVPCRLPQNSSEPLSAGLSC